MNLIALLQPLETSIVYLLRQMIENAASRRAFGEANDSPRQRKLRLSIGREHRAALLLFSVPGDTITNRYMSSP